MFQLPGFYCPALAEVPFLRGSSWTSQVPKIMAQCPIIREDRQYRVHYFGAILPIVFKGP